MGFLSLAGAGLMAGIAGTGLGGIIAAVISNRNTKLLAVIMSFAAGLMLAVTCFDLLPGAFEAGGSGTGIAGCISGFVLMMYLETHLQQPVCTAKNERLYYAGILTGIGIALHNFPEGLAIGAGFESSVALGYKLLLTIALHDVPEGIAMGLPLKMSGVGKTKMITYTFLAGMPTALGALFGKALGSVSPLFISLSLGLAAGAMLHVVFGDLLPEAGDIHRGRLNTLSLIVGLIIGMMI